MKNMNANVLVAAILVSTGASAATNQKKPNLSPVLSTSGSYARIHSRPNVEKPFTATITSQTSSSFHHFDSADHTAQSSLILIPSVKLSELLTLSLRAHINKDLENEREVTM